MSEVAATVPLLERLSDEGLPIIMIEHRTRELFRMADRVIVLDFGAKIAEGSPREIINNQKVKEAYLGVTTVYHSKTGLAF